MHICRSCLLFLLPLLASAQAPDSGAISSSSASYDGNALILTGQVALDHGLGKIRAEEAILQKQESGKEFPFSTIALKNAIQIELRDHARLRCGRADLDFTALRGKLFAAGKEKVMYTDRLKQGGNQVNSLCLMSDVIDLAFEKVPHSDQRSDFLVHEIMATGSVVIDYAQSLTLQAEKPYTKGVAKMPSAPIRQMHFRHATSNAAMIASTPTLLKSMSTDKSSFLKTLKASFSLLRFPICKKEKCVSNALV